MGEDDSEDDLEAHIDAADRLERVIDVQIETLNGIDDKAEYSTRLIAILLGIILSLLSAATQTNSISFDGANIPTIIAFTIGVICLILSMGEAIITYLSSRLKIGLNRKVGYLLSNSDYETNMSKHIKGVLGSYGYAIEKNKEVIEKNADRFRITLTLLLLGVLFLSIAAISFIQKNEISSWLLLGIGIISGSIFTRYIIRRKYLTLEDSNVNND